MRQSIFLFAENLEQKTLTFKDLYNMSRRITKPFHLRLLGIKGLRLDEHVIDWHLEEHSANIERAAYEVLISWCRRQSGSHRQCDRVRAYRYLHAAMQYVDKLMQG